MKLAGKCYWSRAWVLDDFAVEYIEFYANNTFFYKTVWDMTPSSNFDITGRWHMNGDTIILSSSDFKKGKKYTDLDGNIDAYIIERDTLFPVMKDGVDRYRYFYEASKKDKDTIIYLFGVYSPEKDKLF